MSRRMNRWMELGMRVSVNAATCARSASQAQLSMLVQLLLMLLQLWLMQQLEQRFPLLLDIIWWLLLWLSVEDHAGHVGTRNHARRGAEEEEGTIADSQRTTREQARMRALHSYFYPADRSIPQPQRHGVSWGQCCC